MTCPCPPRRNCKVTEIDFGSRSKEVNGALDERFGELEDLEKFNLASSKASGDITLLRSNTKLKVLSMAGTRVSGDISTILSWEEIQSVDLSGTRVVGQLDGNWTGCCAELQNLRLAEVVELKVVPPQAGEKHSWMPKLTNLDLTGSSVNLEVSSLLKSFQRCTSLGSLQAGGCGLRGRLDGRDGTPSLVALDLRVEPFDTRRCRATGMQIADTDGYSSHHFCTRNTPRSHQRSCVSGPAECELWWAGALSLVRRSKFSWS